MRLRSFFIGGFLVLGLLVFGFIMLIRGCLSQYDERSALTPALYIEKDNKAVLFSLVKYEEATSYSQRGGFISKSVNTSYFIQTNDPQTGAQLAEEKVKDHSDIKTFPVETLGSSQGLAWIFMGELMAFDPFSLEKKADKHIIETKNPSLKNKLLNERRFYKFNPSDRSIFITANDGTFWKLNTTTLLATQQDEAETIDPIKAAVKSIEELRDENRKAQDSLYRNEMNPALYAAGKMSRQQYMAMQKRYFVKRDSLYKQRDSIQNLLSALRNKESALRQIHSAIESLQRSSKSYQQIKTNQDTANGLWWGLYSQKEIDDLSDYVRIQTAYEETARRQLYTSVYIDKDDGNSKIDMKKITPLNTSQLYLQGGFLLDKQTALPIRLGNGGGSLIVHKDKIGNEGKIIISRIDRSGKLIWTMEPGLKEWIDWIATPNRLFIFGADNPALSGDDCNVLWCIDLATGKANKYDYFKSNAGK